MLNLPSGESGLAFWNKCSKFFDVKCHLIILNSKNYSFHYKSRNITLILKQLLNLKELCEMADSSSKEEHILLVTHGGQSSIFPILFLILNKNYLFFPGWIRTILKYLILEQKNGGRFEVEN